MNKSANRLIEWVTLPFRALDAAVLYRVLALRSSIFVVEQECLYQDIDGLDQHALIVVGIRPWGATGDHGATLFDVIATARILPPGVGFDDPSMGRLCVAQPFRQRGLGRTLLAHTLQSAREVIGHHMLELVEPEQRQPGLAFPSVASIVHMLACERHQAGGVAQFAG